MKDREEQAAIALVNDARNQGIPDHRLRRVLDRAQLEVGAEAVDVRSAPDMTRNTPGGRDMGCQGCNTLKREVSELKQYVHGDGGQFHAPSREGRHYGFMSDTEAGVGGLVPFDQADIDNTATGELARVSLESSNNLNRRTWGQFMCAIFLDASSELDQDLLTIRMSLEVSGSTFLEPFENTPLAVPAMDADGNIDPLPLRKNTGKAPQVPNGGGLELVLSSPNALTASSDGTVDAWGVFAQQCPTR